MIQNNNLNAPSLRNLLLSGLVYIIFIVIFTYFNVLNKKQTLYQQLDKQLEDAAMVTDLLLPPTLHHKAMKQGEYTTEQKINHILSLSAFTNQRDIIYVYTLILRDDEVLFTSSSATPQEIESGENLSFYFDPYVDVDPRVFDVFKNKQKTFLEYTDQWGIFRSVYIPRYSPDGTLYLAVADLSISHIQALLNEQIVNSVFISLLFFLFAYPIYHSATRQLKNGTNLLNDEVQRQTLAIKNSQEKLVQNQRALLTLAKENVEDQTTTFTKIVSIAAKQIEVARVGIWLFDNDKKTIICQAQYNQGEVSTDFNSVNASEYPHYFNKLSNEGFISADDVLTHPDTYEFLNGYTSGLGITSMLDTPIFSEGVVIGVCCFEHTGTKRKWSREDEEFARAISDLCSQVVLNEQRKKAEKRLNVQAHYDGLTKLPNRALFADRFSQAIAQSKRTNSILAICFLDLDNFKPVNDTFGHDIGDQLLIEVAKRLEEVIREHDTVSRQGGDEFTLLLSNIESKQQCEQILSRINSTLSQPYVIENTTHNISVSIGTTLYPNDKSDLDTLLRHADQAMYQAKLAGKNQQAFYNSDNDQQIALRQTKLQEIALAIKNNEFCLYYQPKINLRTGEVFGAEALIRWQHPSQGLIQPLDFLSIIENDKLETKLGNWVINEALQQIVEWQSRGINLQVSVNISSYHLQNGAFFNQLKTALKLNPTAPPKNLQLEILESSALSDLSTISKIIDQCQTLLGVSVALDDFGTGYSALAHIRDLSADVIKIDRTFVRDLLIDPNDYSIIEGIIGLANAFNHKVIAEGVETNEHGLMLLIMGCEEAQGYGISRPLPAHNLPSWLSEYKHNPYWLRFTEKNLSAKQKRLILLQLTTKHWYDNTLFLIQTSLTETKLSKSHLALWFDRLKSEKIFPSPWILELKQQNDLMLKLADELLIASQANQPVAPDKLNEFKIAYQNLQILLQSEATHDILLYTPDSVTELKLSVS